ncbi:MAG: hypothetical protein HYY49_03795, partial [Ignavibacteriales bacterium]|nr:hypothetical protein [Ignavibacteriales bacterium]
MAKDICIFEDDRSSQFLPLTYFRPVYNLRCGISPLRDKIVRSYLKAKVSLHCREYLASYMRLRNPGVNVNEISSDECLFVNGRVVADGSLAKKIPLNQKNDVVYVHGDSVVAAHVSGAGLKKLKGRLNSVLTVADFDGLPKTEVDVELVSYPWNLVHENGRQLAKDYEVTFSPKGKRIRGNVHKSVHVVGKDFALGEGSYVKPGVVIDTEDGPVIIGKNVKVFPNATIIGPVFIGDNSWIKVG